jgi:hypothetical protein
MPQYAGDLQNLAIGSSYVGRIVVANNTRRDTIVANGTAVVGSHILVTDSGIEYKVLTVAPTYSVVANPSANIVTSFVFRPGATPTDNVFDNFTTLWAAVQAVDGLRTILIDGSLTGNTAAIPAGAYAFGDGQIEIVISTAHVLTLDDGVTMTGAVTVSAVNRTNASLSSTSNSPVMTVPGDTLAVRNVGVRALGTAPLISIASGFFTAVLDGTSSIWINGATPIATISGTGFLSCLLRAGSNFGDRSVTGTAGTLSLAVEGGTTYNAADIGTLFSGTKTLFNLSPAYSTGYTPTTPADWLPIAPVNILEALDSLRTGRRPAETGDFLVVHNVDGDNDNIGNVDASGSQLASVQEAIDRWWPAHLATPSWSSDTVKHILVKFSGTDCTENYVKPEHVGGGQLLIEYEQNVLHTVTQSGAISGLPAGHLGTRRTVNFVGTPFVAGTLEGKFLTPVDDQGQASSNNAAFIQDEHAVIISNTTSSVDVSFVNPGIQDAFSYFDGAALMVVENQGVQNPEPIDDLFVTGFGPFPPQIANMGGMLVIKGATIDRTNAVTDRQILLSDVSASNNRHRGTIFTMAVFRDTALLIENSRSFYASSSYFDAGTGVMQLRSVDSLTLLRNLFTSGGGSYQLLGCQKIHATNNHITRYAGTTNKLTVTDCRDLLFWDNDSRIDVNMFVWRSWVNIQTNSWEGMGNDALELIETNGIVAGNIGSTGNTAYGIRVGSDCFLDVRTNNTLTGTSGDKIVGSIPATHAAGDVHDLAARAMDTNLLAFPGPAAENVFAIKVANAAALAALTGPVYTGRHCEQQDTEETYWYDGTTWHLTVKRGDATNNILLQQLFS